MPADAGIQSAFFLDSGFCRNDGMRGKTRGIEPKVMLPAYKAGHPGA